MVMVTDLRYVCVSNQCIAIRLCSVMNERTFGDMRKPVRGRPRSQQAHDAILSAAIELTRKVGYDRVSMEGIAARAGVGKATVYRRWSVKESVICEALEKLMKSLPTPDTGTTRGDLL